MSQTKAQLLDNIKDNVQLDARNSLRFADTDSSHYVAFKAPATVSSNVTWTLPAADGSANYVLATDGSGTLSWIADPAGQWVTSGSNIYFTGGNVGIGDSSPSNPLSVTGVAAFNGDVTFTGASYNALWDKSDNALEFADNVKVILGSGDDTHLYHNGSHTYISHRGTGDLILEPKEGENGVVLKADGAVELYYDNSRMLRTTATGGILSGNWSLTDDNKMMFGTGDDLYVYHDGSTNIIDGRYHPIELRHQSEVHIKCVDDGAVELYYDNSKKFETDSNGIWVSGALRGESVDLADDKKILLGSGDDLEIYHSGNQNLIKSTNGRINLLAAETRMESASGSEVLAKFIENGAVELFHDNVKKLETASTGIEVNGGKIELKGAEGGEAQLQLKADEGDDNDDSWRIVANTDNNLILGNLASGTWENSIKAIGNGAVELYYDNSKKLETDSSGVSVWGNLMLESDDDILYIGHGSDIRIWHDGANSHFRSYTGELRIEPDNGQTLSINNQANTVDSAKFIIGGSVELYYDNSKKLETDSFGTSIQGDCLKVPDGTAGSPGFTWNNEGNADTGIFRPGANIIAFSNAGTENFRIAANGDLTATDTTIGSNSDQRLKTNINDFTYDLAKFKQFKPKTFDWKNPGEHGNKTGQRGFLAQDVESIDNYLVGECFIHDDDPDRSLVDSDGKFKTSKLGKNDAMYISVINQLITKIETLETKVAALESA